jgi:hypothetical protein
MDTRPWYPFFERQALFLRAVELYTQTVRCQIPRFPESRRSEYNAGSGTFRLADKDGFFATIDLATGNVLRAGGHAQQPSNSGNGNRHGR